jgi:hypothetical protein
MPLYKLRIRERFEWPALNTELGCEVVEDPRRQLWPSHASVWLRGEKLGECTLVGWVHINPNPLDGLIRFTVAGLPVLSEADILAGVAELHGEEFLPKPVYAATPDSPDNYDEEKEISRCKSWTHPWAKPEVSAKMGTVARCPACNRVLRTPEAKQCFWCGHDWHKHSTEA